MKFNVQNSQKKGLVVSIDVDDGKAGVMNLRAEYNDTTPSY